jgi:hypothetical protein
LPVQDGFSAGDYAAFYGAVEFGFDGIMKVVSVTDDDNFVAEAHNYRKEHPPLMTPGRMDYFALKLTKISA